MDFHEHLVSGDPSPQHASQLRTFGQFVGSWDLRWSEAGNDDPATEVLGELHFGWILGGRAIQDVWIVPSRDRRTAGDGREGFWGTTVRFFDPDLGAWRSTWMNPIAGRVLRFIGREIDDEIHLVTTDDKPFQRWRFTEIGPDRFVWLGEYSPDEARTWHLEEKMIATRA